MDDVSRYKPDAELIASCLDGSGDAWESLVRRYRRLVYSIPIKWGLPKEDAMEIFQAVWLDCFRELHLLRNPGVLQAWLIKIAVRKCYRYSQTVRARTEKPLNGDFEEIGYISDPRPELIRRLHQEQLIRMGIEKLTERCQQVLRALFFEEPLPSYSTIAERLGLSSNSIGFTRDRCLERLGRILEELGYER